MSNFILIPESDFVTYTPVASSEASGYADDNLADYAHPAREWRSANTLETTVVLDTGVADCAVAAVYLGDVNFTAMSIEGNASDAWSSPSFTASVTISRDERVRRYKGYFTLSGFAYRYLRLKIPAQTPTDGQAFYRIGTVVLASSETELPINPVYPYKLLGKRPFKRIEFDGGQVETLLLGLKKRFEAEIEFEAGQTHESGFWTINGPDPGDIFLFYENNWHGGGSSKAYLVRPDDSIRVSWEQDSYFKTDSLRLVEVM